MYKRILVAIDGSEQSTRALVAALQLARDGEGRVRLLHVLEDFAYVGGLEYGGDLQDAVRRAGSAAMEDAMAVASSAGVPAERRLVEAGQRLGEVVAQEARDWAADLVVVGTHGRRGVGRMFLGSGAEQVLRLAPVPVLVVRTPDQPPAA